ncbi:tyrosine-protein kinase Src42A-like [Macrobrachium rosenbergii]|uniref:tyrosine-protein kinase Src42A-like n=1 Tax=Macrobrachium rosenbergii TaxID=79674 RepID=UPI0034D5E907
MPFRWLLKKLRRRYERDYGPSKDKNVKASGRPNSLGDLPSASSKEPNEEPTVSNHSNFSQPNAYVAPDARQEEEDSLPPNNHETPEGRLYVVLYDYDARTSGELNIRKNEIVEVLNEPTAGWWYVKKNSEVGYIPANYIAEYLSIQAQEWYFSGMRRVECEHLLLNRYNPQGAFLIRDSETRNNSYSLSVVCDNKVRHYKIHYTDDGTYSINRTMQFKSLECLVAFYKQESAGLCTRLTRPCTKVCNPDTVGLSFDTSDQWEIPKSMITLSKRLGSGNFGEVYEGLFNGHTKVAVKTLKPGTMRKEDFLAEAQFLKKLRHKNLLQLYAVSTKEEPLYIITELMQHGSLLSYLRDGPGQKAELDELIHIAAQVAGGMWYLETQNYIHRDLAARNVLIGAELQVKVADFGLSRLVDEEIYQAREGGQFPIKWTAPEALSHNKFSIKSDVWAFGVLLYEIITRGGRPYPGMSNNEVQERLEQGYRMPKHPGCPQLLYQIMLNTWDIEPQRRPNFETLQWKLEDFFSLDVSEYKDAEAVA